METETDEFMQHVTREFMASYEALEKQLTAIGSEATANRMLCISTLSKEMTEVMNETVNLAGKLDRDGHPAATGSIGAQVRRTEGVPSPADGYGAKGKECLTAEGVQGPGLRQGDSQPHENRLEEEVLHVLEGVHHHQTVRAKGPSARQPRADQGQQGQALPGLENRLVPREEEEVHCCLHQAV